MDTPTCQESKDLRPPGRNPLSWGGPSPSSAEYDDGEHVVLKINWEYELKEKKKREEPVQDSREKSHE